MAYRVNRPLSFRRSRCSFPYPDSVGSQLRLNTNSAIGKLFYEAHGRMDRLNESHKKILRKCQGKFDCLVFDMFYIKKFKPNLNVQTDYIRAKLFVYPVNYFLHLLFVLVFVEPTFYTILT